MSRHITNIVRALRRAAGSTFVALLWLSGLSAQVQAQSTPPTAEAQAGFYKLKVGDVEVVALSDGTVPLDTKLLQLKDKTELGSLLHRSFLSSPLDVSVNAFLIELPGHLVLVDAGTAELFGPSLGKLPDSLHRAGFETSQITDILVTHIHTDHTGGLMQGSQMVFPNAIVRVEQKEVDYWLNTANRATARDDQKVFFDQAVQKFKPYVDAGKVVPFDGAVELLPGLRSKPAPGHTPGHTNYVLESQGQKLVFWGDLVHVGAVQFPDPSVTIDFDVNPKEAEAARRSAFEDAAQRGYLVAGAHISFPGIGHLRKVTSESAKSTHRIAKPVDAAAYAFVPVPYLNNAPYTQ